MVSQQLCSKAQINSHNPAGRICVCSALLSLLTAVCVCACLCLRVCVLTHAETDKTHRSETRCMLYFTFIMLGEKWSHEVQLC